MSFDDCSAIPMGRPDSSARPEANVSVTLALSVEDAHALWTAAAMRLADGAGLTADDIVELIGPEQDPSLADCITAMMTPVLIAGCSVNALDVKDVARRPLRAAQASSADELQAESVERQRSKPPRALPATLVLASASLQSASPQAAGGHRL